MHIHAHACTYMHAHTCTYIGARYTYAGLRHSERRKGAGGADDDWRDADARSPLHHAAEQGHAGVSHARVCVCEREQRGRDEVRWRVGAGSSYVYEA